MKRPVSVAITAIIAITLLEGWALYLGYDGTILSIVMGLLGIAGGFTGKLVVDKVKRKNGSS